MDQLGINSQPSEQIWNFFFPARFVHKSQRRRGETGERGSLSAVGPADGAGGARGKGIWRQIPLTIGSSVRDERRYDRSQDEKQIEPIIFKSTHRFLCTRRTKIRSKRRQETDETYYHQSQHIGSSVRDERRYDRRETSQKEQIPRQSNHLTI